MEAIPTTLFESVVRWEDAKNCAVLPGLIESHSHCVYTGGRVADFRARCAGESYEQIAARGGGIRSTMARVRDASVDELVDASLPRLYALLAQGVTTVEIKSGYGLDLENELKMLWAIKELQKRTPQTLVPTFLGAHTLPPEYIGNREGYLRLVRDEMLPRVAQEGLAEFCDVFCEHTAFTVDEAREVLVKAQEHGIPGKLHAEQLSNFGGTALGAELQVASVDHLEYLSEEAADRLAESQTVAAILPGATLFLGLSRWAPARMLIDRQIPVALSTDCNPGSSPTTNLQLMMNLACTQMGMTIEESIAGVTTAAARSLNRADCAGSLAVGQSATLIVLKGQSSAEMVYPMGGNSVARVMIEGKWIVG